MHSMKENSSHHLWKPIGSDRFTRKNVEQERKRDNDGKNKDQENKDSNIKCDRQNLEIKMSSFETHVRVQKE